MKHAIHLPSNLYPFLGVLFYAAIAVVAIFSLIGVVLWAVGTFY